MSDSRINIRIDAEHTGKTICIIYAESLADIPVAGDYVGFFGSGNNGQFLKVSRRNISYLLSDDGQSDSMMAVRLLVRHHADEWLVSWKNVVDRLRHEPLGHVKDASNSFLDSFGCQESDVCFLLDNVDSYSLDPYEKLLLECYLSYVRDSCPDKKD